MSNPPENLPKNDAMSQNSQIAVSQSQNSWAKPPGPFMPGTNWRIWLKKFTNFLTLRKITDPAEKLLIFLQEVGDDNYALLEGRMGKELEDCTLNELTAAMETHFQPRHLAISERYKLLNCLQKPGQSLSEFYATLQMMAKTCSFDRITDALKAKHSFVVMAFVSGIRSDDVRRRLLEKDDEITPENALELAEAFERVLNTTKNLNKSEAQPEAKVAGIQNKSSGFRNENKSNFKARANLNFDKNRSSAYKNSHKSNKFSRSFKNDVNPRYDARSSNSKSGRFQTYHKRNKSHFRNGNSFYKNKRKVGIVDTDTDEPRNEVGEEGRSNYSDNDEGILNVRELKSILKKVGIKTKSIRYYKSYPRPELRITVNGKTLVFELDTGACMSVVGIQTWRLLGCPKLTKVDYEAASFNGQVVPFLGVFQVTVQWNGKTEQVYLHVVDGHIGSLCGRDMLVALQVDCGPHFNVSAPKNENSQIRIHTETPEIQPKSKDDATAVKNAKDMSITQVRDEMKKILAENSEVFESGLGKCTTKKATLKFKGEVEPKFFRHRPVPYAVKPKVDAAIDEMVQKGIWEKVSHPKEFVTPLVIVPKANGNVRICGDFKVTVNPCLDIDQHPLPRPDDVFHALVGGKKFSKMDLSEAYMQIEMDEKSKDYLMVNTHKGLYRYNRLPFGIASAPAIFQEIMDNILAGMDGVSAYLDDIIITARTDEEHLKRLGEVLKRLKEAGLRVKREKCSFMMGKLEFLGHILSAEGIQTSPKKLEAIVKMPEPKNLKEVVSFLSMVQYYGKFVPNLATIAAPLNQMRKQGVSFEMTQERKKAFEEIKKRLTQTDILTHFNPDIPVVLATDASDYGLGAVIYHKLTDGTEKVIAYASRTLTQTERNYAQIEKEALGIVYGVEKFNQFLYGRKFTLLTDHQPLTKIFGPKTGLPVIAARRLHRWALRLMAYSFDIEYRKTDEFGNADGLSRLPNPSELPTTKTVKETAEVNALDDENVKSLFMNEEDVRTATEKDPILAKVKEFIQKGWPRQVSSELKFYATKADELSVHKGCILWHSRVVIPPPLQTRALRILHKNHFGRNRMIALARTKIWFPGIDGKIEEIARRCETCAIMSKKPTKAPLHPWEVPEKVWQRLHIDFCETSPNDKYLVVIDAKSKWPEVIYMRNITTTAKTIKKLSEIFATHGIPEQIVSDNGPQFASKEFANFCKEWNIEQTLTAPYHPNSNGEAERFVQTFKDHLYKSTREGVNKEKAQTELLFHYRVTPHPATGISPAEMLMGRKLRTELDIVNESKQISSIAYRETMKRNHDKISKFRNFQVGNEVYVMNFTQSGDKWIPGIVTHKYGQNLYEVQTIMGSKKIHINQMKKKNPPLRWEELTDEWIINNEKLKLQQAQKPKMQPFLTRDQMTYPRRSERKRKAPVRFHYEVFEKRFNKRSKIKAISQIPISIRPLRK